MIVGGGGKVLEIPVKDEKEQDKVLTMVGAAQTASQALSSAMDATAKAMSKAGPPPAKVASAAYPSACFIRSLSDLAA